MEEGGAKKGSFFRFLGNEMMVLETKCGLAAVGLCRGFMFLYWARPFLSVRSP